MANKKLFSSQGTRTMRTPMRVPRADTVTHHGTPAYKLPSFHALCQLAATGTMHNTFYAPGGDQLTQLTKLAAEVTDEQLAKLAIYARQRAQMKDMPAALLLLLSQRSTELFHLVFDRVVINGKMMRTFFQLLRSGKFGRKAMSYSISRAFRNKISGAMDDMAENANPWLLHASIGNDPSYRDILRCLHYKPRNNFERAVNGWLGGYEMQYWNPGTYNDLPRTLQALDAFRRAETESQQIELMASLRGVRWDLLSDSIKGKRVWREVARNMAPFALRMNLNTLARHGVFEDQNTAAYVADRVADPEEVRRGGSFPYAYFMAYQTIDSSVPQCIRSALQRAAELSCGNIPALPGPVVIGCDVSSSMSAPATGNQGSGTSKATCVMVAAVFAAALWRRNPNSIVVPFNEREVPHNLDPDDSLLSISDRLAKMCSGGTECSVPLTTAMARYRDRAFAGAIIISDNQSWFNASQYSWGGGTATATEWRNFANNQRRLGKFSDPKYVGINIQPYTVAQNKEEADIMNVGGFSDSVFEIVSAFFENDLGRFVKAVESVDLYGNEQDNEDQ